MKFLIDNNLVCESGNIAETYIEYPDSQPAQGQITDVQTLMLELSYAPIKGIEGYRLIEEEVMPDGSRKVRQEFNLAPDVAYALFKHWEQLDRESKD